MIQDHSIWMRLALQEAQKALNKNEVPVGAVVVHEGVVIGKGHNLIETLQDPTAHAEMLAITAAANSLASWRLDDSVLYVTLEPCMMCAGAVLLSRIDTIVFGAADSRYGGCGGALQVAHSEHLDVQATLISGVLEQECSDLIRTFFRKLRKHKPDVGGQQ